MTTPIGKQAVDVARAFKRQTGEPLILSRAHAGQLRREGVNVAELEREGAIHITRPIPIK